MAIALCPYRGPGLLYKAQTAHLGADIDMPAHFYVTTAGITAHEEICLKSMLSLLVGRTGADWAYSATEAPNLVIVNRHSLQGMQAVERYRGQVVFAALSKTSASDAASDAASDMLSLVLCSESLIACLNRAADILACGPRIVAGCGADIHEGGMNAVYLTQARAHVQAPPATERLRALIVDDNITLQRLMDLTLRPLGIELDFAVSGEQALHEVGRKNYDIVFLDVTLPGMDGYRVCKTIKGNKATRQVPVVMLTSRDSVFDKVRGAMAGCDVYLTKPINRSKLLATLKQQLSTHAPIRSAA